MFVGHTESECIADLTTAGCCYWEDSGDSDLSAELTCCDGSS